MMMSQILKSEDFTKTQKSRYLENKILLFLQIKKLIRHLIAKNSFVAEEAFNFYTLMTPFLMQWLNGPLRRSSICIHRKMHT